VGIVADFEVKVGSFPFHCNSQQVINMHIELFARILCSRKSGPCLRTAWCGEMPSGQPTKLLPSAV
jgi:hypothetical protein